MCNQDQPHSDAPHSDAPHSDAPHSQGHNHGQFDKAPLQRFRPIGRRRFLAGVGQGTFAFISEVATARNVIAIALGTTTTGLVACAAPPARAPATSAATPVPDAATAIPATPAATEMVMTPTGAIVATTASGLASVTYQQVNLGFVNAYVLVRGNEVAVVDTGVANSQGKIEEVIKAAGRSWTDVRHVILTHYHQDHVGSMDAVMAASTQATAYAGAADIPQIQTSAKLQELTDGQEIFGLQIVATPGHTAGHMSVYDPAGSAFITGDAIVNEGGTIGVSPAQYTADATAAKQSVLKIAGLKFETAYFMHGSTLDTGASDAIAKYAATLN